MSLIAIDVLLDEEASAVEKAPATYERLQENYAYSTAQRKLNELHPC